MAKTSRPPRVRSILGGVAVFALGVLFATDALAQAEGQTTFAYQGVDRHYVLHKVHDHPDPVPLVIALHGLNESVADMRESWTMDAVADREGFDVLYPEALAGRWAYVDSRPVTLPDGGLVDDIGFITALLDKLIADRVVDAAHVYVAGPSNGGLLAWTMACAASDRIAGVPPLITGMIERQIAQCHPKRLVPLVVIAGTDDWIQAYDGAMAPNFRELYT